VAETTIKASNLTTVLLIAPVALLITQELRVRPYPFLFAKNFASNVDGTATLIGDPSNIMIGSAMNLSCNDFPINLAKDQTAAALAAGAWRQQPVG